MIEETLDQEYYDWLDNTKYDLLSGIDKVLSSGAADMETLEIMRGLIQTIKIKPRSSEV